MDASQLHVICTVSNPMRWESRMRLYREFEQHMLDSGVNLTTVEVAYGSRPMELEGRPFINHVGLRAAADALVWSKESP